MRSAIRLRAPLLALWALALFGCPPPRPIDDAGTPDGGGGVVDDAGVDAGPELVPADDALLRELCAAQARGMVRLLDLAARTSRDRCSVDDLDAPVPNQDRDADALCESGLLRALTAAAAAGHVVVNLDALKACQAQRPTTPPSSDDAGLPPEAAACADVLVGIGPAGAACTTPFECAAGLTCRAATRTSAALTCGAPAALAEPCLDATNLNEGAAIPCAAGLACVDGACAAVVGNEGASCEFNSDCTRGLFCAPVAPRTCAPRASVGEECALRLCREDLHCDGPTLRCASPVFDGAPCNESSVCARGCSVCRRDVVDGPTLCLDRGAAGAPCVGNGDCRGHLVCDDGTCTPSQADHACSDAFDCPLAFECVDEHCQPLAAPGAPCAADRAPSGCDTGHVCRAGTCTTGVEAEPCTTDEGCAAPLRCIADGTESSCRAAPAPGDACFAGVGCATGDTCVEGTCTKNGARGTPCSLALTCDEGLQCDSFGTCIAGQPGGARCDDDVECTSNACRDGVCLAAGASCTSSAQATGLFFLFSALLLVPRRLRRRAGETRCVAHSCSRPF